MFKVNYQNKKLLTNAFWPYNHWTVVRFEF